MKRIKKKRRSSLVFAGCACLGLAASAQAAEFVETYTAEQLREMAINFNQVLEGKEFDSIEPSLKAMEFKGYVAGALDSRPRDSELNGCVRRHPVSLIAARTASVLASSSLDRGVSAVTKFWVALHFACNEDTWKSE